MERSYHSPGQPIRHPQMQDALHQLEQMRDVVERQAAKLSHACNENALLAKENEELRFKVDLALEQSRRHDEKFMEQNALMTSLQEDITRLRMEKNKIEEDFFQMERKYKRAKAASREFAKELEYEHEVLRPRREPEASPNILDRSRAAHQRADDDDSAARQQPEQVFDYEADRREVIESYQEAVAERDQLAELLEREQNCSRSLANDLAAARTLVLDRDESVDDLKSRLSQTTEQLRITQSDLQIERARADELEMEKLDQTQAYDQFCIAFQEAEQRIILLEEEIRAKDLKILSLDTKLHLQGADLANTKRELRDLRIHPLNRS